MAGSLYEYLCIEGEEQEIRLLRDRAECFDHRNVLMLGLDGPLSVIVGLGDERKGKETHMGLSLWSKGTACFFFQTCSQFLFCAWEQWLGPNQ